MHTKEGAAARQSSEKEVFSPQEMTEVLQYLAENAVLKEDLDRKFDEQEIKLNRQFIKFAQDIKEHMTREAAKVRGDLTALAHRQDAKTNTFIEVVGRRGAITKKDSKELLSINPFLQPTDL